MNQPLNSIKKWLIAEHIPFTSGLTTEGAPYIMTITEYNGAHPPKEVHETHYKIMAKIKRFEGLKGEPRGHYTGRRARGGELF